MFAVVCFGIGDFAGVCFGGFGAVWGVFHSADGGFEGHVLVLPFHEGLLGG